ncbi:MAG: hypothetical protein PHU74_01555 [Candidatus Pacebacteria bacterium]|nr:hypothetical protein [Candidatus Paceibacterota bacterium]
MKKIISIVLILLVVFIGIFLFLQNKNLTSLTLISPNGGEVLEEGSTYTIKWSSKNIPADSKISISIRRVVPSSTPPTEGQEFDPLIFFNLDNTGSVDWTVSDMYPAGDYLLNIISYVSLPVNNPILDESDATFQIVKSPKEINWKTYRNENFGYSLNYPDSLILREFSETKTGASFHFQDEAYPECITVSAREAVKNKENLSFDQYVREAAIEEIQDFKRLNSIEKITTNSGLNGYKTTWGYTFLGGEEKISLPITYFEGPGNIQGINYKTIQLTLNDLSCENIYEQILLTFSK